MKRANVLLVLVLGATLAGCMGGGSGGDPDEAPGGDGGYTAKHAAELARAHAATWSPDADLVGLEAQELAPGTTGRTPPPGVPAATDPVVGNGRAPFWLAGLRSADGEFLLVAVAAQVTEIPRGGDHTLARARTPLADWRLDSDDAADAAWPDRSSANVYSLLRMEPGDDGPVPVWTLQDATAGEIVRLNAASGEIIARETVAAAYNAQAAFAVFVNGEQLGFADPRYDFEATQFYDAHLNVAADKGDAIIQLRAANVRFSTFLGSLDISYQPMVLGLDEGHGGSSWKDSNTTRTRLYVDAGDGEGFHEVDDGPTHVLAGGQRLLLTYGANSDMTPSELKRQQQAVARVEG